jgi:hypothetical protein
MRQRAGLLVVSALLLVGCTASSKPAGPVVTSSGQPQPPAATAARLGAPNCRPASPTGPAAGIERGEVLGTGHGAELWGLLFTMVPLPMGKRIKIVWRMTGSGPLRIVVRSADGTLAKRWFGPEPHGGSNWHRPGDEWGSGFVLTKRGCWGFHLTRTVGGGDVWLPAR